MKTHVGVDRKTTMGSMSAIACSRQLVNHAGVKILTTLKLPHDSYAALSRTSASPHRSSDYRVRDGRRCNLENCSGAHRCRRALEGMRFQHYLCYFGWVRHVEGVADTGCKVGVGYSCRMVRIWVPH